MCGTQLGRETEATDTHIDNRRIERPAQNHGSYFVPGDRTTSASNPNELSLFQSGPEGDDRDDNSDEIFSYPAASRSYRVYVGIALAIVIFALGYMAWRSAQATENSRAAPSAPPAITTEPAPVPVPSSSAASEPRRQLPADETPAAQNQEAPPAQVAAEAASNKIRPETGPDTAAAAVAASTSGARSPQEQATAGVGAEELATAQGYLNGTNGQQRNSSEAAKWLWKAIAKHNSAASLLLADLYLKGDGVSKNCDQARVLLDAAALKGVKDAGTKLRNLQAFGCE